MIFRGLAGPSPDQRLAHVETTFYDVRMRAIHRVATALALTLACATVFLAQQSSPATPAVKDPSKQNTDDVYICPMDPDVRSHNPGTCPRCGMKLRAGIPDPVEYHLDLALNPKAPRAGQKTELAFSIHDPWKDRPVKNFQVVHEKLFHMFIVSRDLEYFVHDHPVLQPDGEFLYTAVFPHPGMYRVLGDFYPDGATPQLIPKTVMVPGKDVVPAKLTRDYSAKTDHNLTVAFHTEPAQPIAGMKTQLHFDLKPGDKIEKYLGAWGHMLAASDDLIDTIHEHPFIADGGSHIQFNIVFPRPKAYRIWVQFQRDGVVNTVRYDVPVEELH